MKNQNTALWGIRVFALGYVVYLMVDLVLGHRRGEVDIPGSVLYPVVALLGLGVLAVGIWLYRTWKRERQTSEDSDETEEP